MILRLNGTDAPATRTLRPATRSTLLPRPEPGRIWAPSDRLSVAGSALLSVAILLPFVALSEPCRHWFVIPVFVCGVLIGIDLLDWMRGRMDLLDPVGLIGILGYLGFFIAPLLHVSLNLWMAWVAYPPDWREWLGRMGLVNIAGLGVYLIVCRLLRPRRSMTPMPLWEVRNPELVLGGALVVTAALQGAVYAYFGGISGYVDLFERETHTGRSSFTGWGWIFSISESFPRLAFMAFALYLWKRRRRPSWGLLAAAMAVMFGLLILFGGLRGLRSNIVWSLFWTAGVVHFCLRPLQRKIVFFGVAGLLGFMVLYASYKHGGRRDFEKTLAGQEAKFSSSITDVVLWDWSRADVQAFLLYRMSRVGTTYEVAHGRTYLGALSLLIPEAVWPGRPPTKIQEGTQILWGEDWVLIGKASNLYGLGGESMLNFGPAAVPVAFGIFAVLVHAVRRFTYRLQTRDGRIFLLPTFLSLCILGLVCDSDNVLFFLFQYGASVTGVLLFVCRPTRAAAPSWRAS